MLVALPGVTLDQVDTIMSHPQAFAQTRGTLERNYADKRLHVGDGVLIDQATAALALSRGELPTTTAIIASRVCADLFQLDILAEGLQDMDENFTTFLWMEPR